MTLPHGMSWDRYKQWCVAKFIDRWFWNPIIEAEGRREYLDYEFRKTYKPKRYESELYPIGDAEWMEMNLNESFEIRKND